MKYFSTGFFVSDSTRFKDVFNECFGWIQDSPHTAFIPAQLSCDYKDEDFYIESKNERIEIITHKKELNNTVIGCFRYSKITTPHKWITDISFNKNLTTNKIWVQVESSVVSQEAAYLAPQPKKPLIVIRLIDRFSGGVDDEFKISVEPHNLDENGFELATKLINGDTDNKLPVIYVSSKYFYHEHAHNVIPERLARKVCGLAHVVVEPENKYFSSQLRASTNAKNAYAGAVGIYWPRGQSISYYRRGEKSAKEFEDVLFDEVVKATTTMAPVSDCGWSEIQNQKIRDSINTIREKGEYTHELMCLYEEDNITKAELIEDLKSKISILEHRVRSLQSQAPTQASISLNMGAELDFYNGEIKDVVIDSFSSALKNKKESSRGYHILSSLIDNNKHDSETDERKKALKRALTGYRSMDKSILRQLRELGFEATEEGKHWKLIYNEDPRYTYILPKTGSDHRGALNAISDINNIIF